MRFRMINLEGYCNYYYDNRIELVEYSLQERQELNFWLQELKIPHTSTGSHSSVLYLRQEHAVLFALRWS